MQRIVRYTSLLMSLSWFCVVSVSATAQHTTPGDFLTGHPWILEVRYCECQAFANYTDHAQVLPAFLEQSSLLRIGASSGVPGFAAAHNFSIGYEINDSEKVPGMLQLEVATEDFRECARRGSGNTQLHIAQGDWAPVFVAIRQPESKGELNFQSMAVRILPSSTKQDR